MRSFCPIFALSIASLSVCMDESYTFFVHRIRKPVLSSVREAILHRVLPRRLCPYTSSEINASARIFFGPCPQATQAPRSFWAGIRTPFSGILYRAHSSRKHRRMVRRHMEVGQLKSASVLCREKNFIRFSGLPLTRSTLILCASLLSFAVISSAPSVLASAGNRIVRFVDKSAHIVREPLVTARKRTIHSLLNNSPIPALGKNERVVV